MSATQPTDPVAIAGMHRSGTSMVTRALHDAGLHLIGRDAEELISAAEDNPEGFWENKAIVACNDELLELTGGSWDNPPELPPQGADDPRVAGVVDAARAALAGLREHGRWGFKDPRLCLTVPFWLDLEPDLRFVICLRHPLEVALSLKRRNQNSYSLGLALWEQYYAAVLATVPRERRIISHYDAFFVDPEGELARVCTFAGLEPATARVRRDLRHHTIDVSLVDAGVSDTVRELYARLCREAGAAVPVDPPADEGRVRRLVLDGAVASRHADQRKAAVERLEERERQFRAEHAANEEALRARVRDLERQLAETRAVALRQVEQMARQLQAVHHEVSPGPVKKLARRSARKGIRLGRQAAATGKRQVAAKAEHEATPDARAAQRPAEARPQQPQPAARGGAAPMPSATTIARRVVPKVEASALSTAKSAARRLPAPAEARLRVTWHRLRRARAAPKPTARRLVTRMPQPAQVATRRAWHRTAGVRRRLARLRKQSGGGPRAPKGPAYREWRDRYRELVGSTLPAGVPWLVVAPGSPAETREVTGTRATRFPDTRRGAPLADDLAHVAHLEALRCAGNRYLVVPEGSRAWFRRQVELRDHVVHTYRRVVDEPGAGLVFDLELSARGAGQSLRGEVQRLTAGAEHTPAVLVWTSLDIDRELPGVTTFAPPAGPVLPYLDESIEIVVLDEDHDPVEARRVASLGVVTVADGTGGVGITAVDELTASRATTGPRVLVRSTAAPAQDAWVHALAERVAAAGADLELDPVDHDPVEGPGGHDVVIVVEPGVLPLPGAIEAAAEQAHACPDSAITGKVLRDDGRLDSAGGTVFFDRSVALIAEGAQEVRAPWHEYLRPVCWAPGLIAASAHLWTTAPRPPEVPVRTFLREWCAAVWAAGGSVLYQPTVAAVRVSGRGGEASVPLQASAWQRVLDLRPRRPQQLGDGEWRYLLAHDNVEACRG